MVVYWLVLCLVYLTRHLPLKLCYTLAAGVGDLVYAFWPAGRSNVLANMRHVLGPQATEREIRDTTRRSFRNYMRLLVDFARASTSAPTSIEARLKATGWEHLDEAFRQGKGVLLVASHLGSWEAAGLPLVSRGYRLSAVSESLSNERINRLAVESRAAQGIELIPMEYALKRVYAALRRNEAVGLVVDRPLPPDEGTHVQFFGQTITWPTGPAVLALRTGAKIITGYLVRNQDNDYVGEMFPALEFEVTGDRESDVQRITQQVVSIQEDLIRRYPDQWYMFRRMWPAEREE
ncbi:MAG: lysophospholipid acyltransferase family protein [Anaerolineae bacterium]|nr:lysophospholipid acyltransferase family protein [Anaerolineae bacterium]